MKNDSKMTQKWTVSDGFGQDCAHHQRILFGVKAIGLGMAEAGRSSVAFCSSALRAESRWDWISRCSSWRKSFWRPWIRNPEANRDLQLIQEGERHSKALNSAKFILNSPWGFPPRHTPDFFQHASLGFKSHLIGEPSESKFCFPGRT